MSPAPPARPPLPRVTRIALLDQPTGASMSEGTGAPRHLTHVRSDGTAHMVDVSAKQVTARTARAAGRVLLSQEAVRALRDDTVPKGDALAVARIAGIQAAKRTPDLVPLAHPVAVHSAAVELTVADDGVDIASQVRTADRTGIEMEALTCVTVAALALIDMIKAVDKHARITDVRVTAKAGGRSGDWSEDSTGVLAPSGTAPETSPHPGEADGSDDRGRPEHERTQGPTS